MGRSACTRRDNALMGRSKTKRVATMRRRARARRIAFVQSFMPSPPVMGWLNLEAYKHVQALVEGREPPPFVASGVIGALFDALERAGMRRIHCDACGNEWLTRGAVDTCPACRERQKEAN